MAKKIEIMYQRVSDAKRFYEILNNPNFKYFGVKPSSAEEEKEYLRTNSKNRKNNFSHNYTIIYNSKVVGGCGIKINQHRKHIGEIGYFIDEKYWGKGIATKVVKLLEKEGFKKLGLKRIEIIMDKRNIASKKVAIKNNYKKEGILRKYIENNNKLNDSYLYAKVI